MIHRSMTTFLLSAAVALFATAAAASEASLQIWHSFDGQMFYFRGAFESSRVDSLLHQTAASVQSGFNGVPAELAEQFKELIRTRGTYTVRVLADLTALQQQQQGGAQEGRRMLEQAVYLDASLPVCELVRSGFKEDLSVFLGSGGARAVGLDYSAVPVPMPRPCEADKVVFPVSFQTRLRESERAVTPQLPQMALGPRPPALQAVKIAGDASEKLGGDPAQQQSFLRKYWYIVAPLVIIFLFGGGGAPEAGKEGAAPAAAAAAK